MFDVIVIGAGAAGLTASDVLAQNGNSVLIVEARERIGGRIFTATLDGFSIPAELGAEFIHGDLPLTFELAKRSKTKFAHAIGKTYSITNGELEKSEMFPDMDELMEKLHALEQDMTMGKFLETFFGDETYAELREAVKRMAEGLDCADVDKVSAISLRDEWDAEDESKQYHPVEGYSNMLNRLADELRQKQVDIVLNFVVTTIKHFSGHVEVISSDGKSYLGRKVVITIPPSVFRMNEIEISPPVPSHFNALNKIETGGVIKILVEFHQVIWEENGFRKMHNLHFIFSDAFIPTWWTQPHQTTPILTGWLSGPRAMTCALTEDELCEKAYESLAYVFNVSVAELKMQVRAIAAINWVTDPFSRGGYVYRTPESQHAFTTLRTPVDNKIFFAGESLFSGTEMGTVEAALSSGKQVALDVLGISGR